MNRGSMNRVFLLSQEAVEIAGILNAVAEYNRGGWYLHEGQRCEDDDIAPVILKGPKRMGMIKFLGHVLEPEKEMSLLNEDPISKSDFILYALDLSRAVSADSRRSKSYVIASIKLINRIHDITSNVAILIPAYERYRDYAKSRSLIHSSKKGLNKFMRDEIFSIYDLADNHDIPIIELSSESKRHIPPWRQDGEFKQIGSSEPSHGDLEPLLDWIEKRDGSNRTFIKKLLGMK